MIDPRLAAGGLDPNGYIGTQPVGPGEFTGPFVQLCKVNTPAKQVPTKSCVKSGTASGPDTCVNVIVVEYATA